MKLTDKQRREARAYIEKHYAEKEQAHFCERLGISRKQYDNIVRALKDDGKIIPKKEYKVLDRDQLIQLARAWWTMAQTGRVDRAALRQQFGLPPNSEIKKKLERFLDQIGAGDLLDYEKQPTPEFKIGLPPMGAEFTPGARLASLPWRTDYAKQIGQAVGCGGF